LHSLILIDNENKVNELNNNVNRALWGLIKTCKAIKINLVVKNTNKDESAKNNEIIEIAQSRIKKIY
jgi:hypothetical protein